MSTNKTESENNGTESASWIQRTAGVCGGDPCVRTTRHTVAGLVQWRKMGLADEQIIEHHPDLNKADLIVAWDYYANHCEEIEQAIREDEDA